MKEIETLLRERIGLDAASIGPAVVARTARLRMKALGLATAAEYVRRLQTTEAEWTQLIEAVVVAETWFFRDREAFTALVKLVMNEWQPRNPVETLRILSLPCSTGEEPYSLAMALADARFDLKRVAIDAADISAGALACARKAVYGKNSFRGKDLAFRERHFAATREGHVLSPGISRLVRFQQANLLDSEHDGFTGLYDFIFCRNLLIYFDRPTQARALNRLKGLLKDDGSLFVGPAELPLVHEHGFVPANLAMAFACRKAGAKPEGDQKSKTGDQRPRSRAAAAPRAATHEPRVPPRVFSEQDSGLNAVRALADAGKLDEAARLCERHVEENGPSATAYYLLGLVRDANGHNSAVDFYRKALYLEPNHYETLLQMSLLLEKTGDREGAKTYRRRAERAKKELVET
jgi:chemotaxis protein methyltransferase WspC